MADSTGQADIRGLDINKLATGFADEFPSPLRSIIRASTTKARELRWWKKTAGFIDTPDTEGITASQIGYQAESSLPEVIQQTMTRQTSYVKIFKANSQAISEEDKKDSDPDIYGAHVRDITRAIQRQVEQRIYDVIGEATTSGTPNPSTVPNAAATADGWNDTATGDPIADINAGIESLKLYSYDTSNIYICMNQAEEKWLKNYIINVKGSSIPDYSSDQVTKSNVMNILGCKVIVSPLFTTDYVLMITPAMAVWKSFMPQKTNEVYDEITGTYKIVSKESGECLLENPNAGYWITDTIV
jgi:hypothetical protein